ncbi:MAG: 2Fe-2S iron-sulfur cluster binding domain-containing protein [Saprospiraceae bacterium]|nr:2Fe-2S iron-sulfur cluster binding domain-containing protein [Saprospiraceae bacterium]
MAKATIILDGQTIEIETGGKAILETLLDSGHEPPFSCTSGVCTTCMAKLLEGQVEMDVNYGLDEDQVEQGYILTCQSRPVSDAVKLTYDDVQ